MHPKAGHRCHDSFSNIPAGQCIVFRRGSSSSHVSRQHAHNAHLDRMYAQPARYGLCIGTTPSGSASLEMNHFEAAHHALYSMSHFGMMTHEINGNLG